MLPRFSKMRLVRKMGGYVIPLQALLRELAGFNKGLCVIATRSAVADLADHERTSALRLELEQLSSNAGAKLLQALGVKGREAELQSASDDFNGHCLALTLLGRASGERTKIGLTLTSLKSSLS
jgi:hypothetical protein